MKNVTKKLAVILATTLLSLNTYASEANTTNNDQELQAALLSDLYTLAYCRIVDKCEPSISKDQ